MGCGPSSSENQNAIEQPFIDIQLLARPRVVAEVQKESNFFSMDAYAMRETEEKSIVHGDIVDHSATSVSAAPEIEQIRQQKFVECFSHIDANTFQTIPMLSMSHNTNMGLVTDETRSPDEYFRFLEQVTPVLTYLTEMQIKTDHQIVIDI